jgi:hypothetical protein
MAFLHPCERVHRQAHEHRLLGAHMDQLFELRDRKAKNRACQDELRSTYENYRLIAVGALWEFNAGDPTVDVARWC